MRIQVLINKRFDTDLLSLADAGYSLSKMIRDTVQAYANGQPLTLFIDEMIPFDMNSNRSIRITVTITDQTTESLMRRLKYGCWSNFCKQVLRNSLVQQNLSCYMSDPLDYKIQQADFDAKYQGGAVSCKIYRQKDRQFEFAGTKIVIPTAKGIPLQQSVPTKQVRQPAGTRPQAVKEKRYRSVNAATEPVALPQTSTSVYEEVTEDDKIRNEKIMAMFANM